MVRRLRYRLVSVLILFFLNPPVTLFGQDPISLSFCDRISPDSMFRSICTLSDDSMSGRETGQPGQKLAAEFIREKFSNYGLSPGFQHSFFQPHPLSIRSSRKGLIQVNQKYFLFLQDFIYMPGYPDSIFSIDSVVFCGYGIRDSLYNDYKGISVRHKTIMFLDGEPKDKKGKYLITRNTTPSAWSLDWKKKWRVIYEKRPSLVLIVSDDLEKIRDSLICHQPSPELERLQHSPFAVPVVIISREMATYFFPENNEEEFERHIALIKKQKEPSSFPTRSDAVIQLVNNPDCLMGTNVAGLLEGSTHPEEVIVVSAHYDHLGVRDSLIYPGADDNASGTSAVLEMARIFSTAAAGGHRPGRSLLFLTVSGEEEGLLGSEWFVNHLPFPEQNIVANLNIDMIGRTDKKHDSLDTKKYIYIIGSDRTSESLHRLNESLNNNYTKLDLDYSFNTEQDPNHFYSRSDQYNFAKKNIPVIFYFNGTHTDYHKPTDTPDKILPWLAALRTRLVFLTAWGLADSKDRIRPDHKPVSPQPKH